MHSDDRLGHSEYITICTVGVQGRESVAPPTRRARRTDMLALAMLYSESDLAPDLLKILSAAECKGDLLEQENPHTGVSSSGREVQKVVSPRLESL